MEKSISKIPNWPSLWYIGLKTKILCQIECLENLEYIYGKCYWIKSKALLSSNFFHADLLRGHPKTQTMQTADCRLQTVQTMQTVQTVQTEYFFSNT